MDSYIIKSEGRTMLSIERLRVLQEMVSETCFLPGEMAELGVFQGGASKLIASICPIKPLHLFDTFCGLPSDDVVEGGHTKGAFNCPLEEVQKYLDGYTSIEFHPGFFPDTAFGLESIKFSFVHLDADLYRTTKDALDWFWPRMILGGVIVLDDIGRKETGGVAKALMECGLLSHVQMTFDYQGKLVK